MIFINIHIVENNQYKSNQYFNEMNNKYQKITQFSIQL